jgi:hypothetical protein
MIRFYLVAVISAVFCATSPSNAQTIENIKASPPANGKVTITFDIMNAQPGPKLAHACRVCYDRCIAFK